MKRIRIILIPICIGSWIFVMLSGNELLTKATGDWFEATASVIETSTPKRIKSGQTKGIRYGTCITYSYEAKGILREGKECGIFSYFDTKQEATDALNSYLEDHEQNLIVRYNSGSPDDSYLVVPQKIKRTKYGFIASLSSGVVSSFALLKLFRKRREPDGAGQPM